MADRPFITCHALDTTTGKPAADIAVSLKLLATGSHTGSNLTWTATTNNDGRVTTWSNEQGKEVNAIVAAAKQDLSSGEQMVWSLTFDTGTYFGQGKTFWPEVELRFAAQKDEEHYHVPLLLGPWSYTTYRGS